MGSGDKTQPLTYWGAADWGCVKSTTAGFGSGSATGKVHALRDLPGFEKPRFLYHRVMNAK
jgi:hypothetical protein